MKIIDDFISPKMQDELEANILNSNFPWGRMASSNLANQPTPDYVEKKRIEFLDNNIIDPPQFHHNILINQEPGPFFGWFTPIIDALKFKNIRILRMKMNFNVPYIGTSDNSYGIPHVDLADEVGYTTCIYYVTDADGDTVLFNEKNGHSGKLSIKERVMPKKGRIILFDGNTLHAACPPISNKPRIVVNINIR